LKNNGLVRGNHAQKGGEKRVAEVTVRQEQIEVEGNRFTVTHIPTATSGSWFTIHDACEVWSAVAIDLDGSVVGWRNAPDEPWKTQIEEAIKKVFGIPE
jgi:calcineurin-like phosphoesterase family protein